MAKEAAKYGHDRDSVNSGRGVEGNNLNQKRADPTLQTTEHSINRKNHRKITFLANAGV